VHQFWHYDNDNRFICTERPPAKNTNIHAVIINSGIAYNIDNSYAETCKVTRAVCKTCMPPIWAVSCSGSHCVNTFFVTVNLTFDLVTWKSIGVICQSWSMYLWSFMIIGLSILELSSGNHLTVLSHYDLNLWPSDLKINRGHLPVIINVPMKFHGPRRKHSWVIILKPFYCFE